MIAEDGSRVDILVAYKASAKETMGGRDQIELAIRENEAYTNTALGNSRTNVQVRFVAMEEVPNTIGSTLVSFRTSDNAKVLRDKRNQHKADLVVVIQNSADAAGAATVPCDPASPDFNSKRAFAYVKTRYLRRIRTVSHEIGHLLGAGHEPGEVDNCTLHEDSYAHFFNARNQQGNLRGYATLLSYKNSSNRIPYYSNPDVLYRGVATGIRGQRNNARAIRDARVQVANYRINNTTPVPPGGMPTVCINSPGDEAQLPGRTKITISATITDPNGIAKAELYWKRTDNFLTCDGRSRPDWTCSKQDNVYTWILDVGTGEREFFIRATDSQENTTSSATRKITLQ